MNNNIDEVMEVLSDMYAFNNTNYDSLNRTIREIETTSEVLTEEDLEWVAAAWKPKNFYEKK